MSLPVFLASGPPTWRTTLSLGRASRQPASPAPTWTRGAFGTTKTSSLGDVLYQVPTIPPLGFIRIQCLRACLLCKAAQIQALEVGASMSRLNQRYGFNEQLKVGHPKHEPKYLKMGASHQSIVCKRCAWTSPPTWAKVRHPDGRWISHQWEVMQSGDAQTFPNGSKTYRGHVLWQCMPHKRQWIFGFFSQCKTGSASIGLLLGKEKTNKHKEFWRDTPWCASRLSRGHVPSVPWYVPSVPGTFCPFSIDLHINQAQMSQVSLGRPEFVPGTPPGHPTAKFLYVIFLYRFFSLHIYPSPPAKWLPKLFWAAANGGVTNGGLRGVWLPFLKIGRNRPFSPFVCLFSLFWRVGNPENGGGKAFFLHISLRFA